MRLRVMTVVSGSGLVVALATLALMMAAPPPTVLVAVGRATLAGSADPDVAVAALAAVGAWALVVWLSLGAALTALGRLPNTVGRCTRAIAIRLVPAALRRGIELAIGVTLATGALSASTGLATLPALAAAPNPSRPAATAPAIAPDLDWALAPVRRVPQVPPASATRAVVVHGGDSLWRIAARALGPSAAQAQIAAEWPRWYAANRAVIGADPDLLHPGQRLVPPA